MADVVISRVDRFVIGGILALVLIVGGGNLWATYDQVGNVRDANAQAIAATARANRADATVSQLCHTGNEARAEQASLWNYLIRLAPPPKTTTGQLLLVKFEHHLRDVTAPRNCPSLLSHK